MMYRNSTSHNIKFLDAQNIQSVNDGSYFRGKTKSEDFPNKIEYMTNTGNLPFTFKLDANNVFLIMPVSTARNDVVQVEVNGKKIAKIDTKGNFDNDVPQAFKIFSSSKTDKVTVSIKLVDKEEVNTDFSQNPEENDKEDMHENMQKVKNTMNTPENDFEFLCGQLRFFREQALEGELNLQNQRCRFRADGLYSLNKFAQNHLRCRFLRQVLP